MIKIISFLVFCTFASAMSTTKDYVIGSGSEFKYTGSNGENVKLSIYIAESTFNKLNVEYYFTTNGLLKTENWQQYALSKSDNGLAIEQGFNLTPEMKKPQIMDREFTEANNKGVKVDDFMFNKESDIEKYKIGYETLEVPAGSIKCTHYKKSRDKQIIDFWISDDAGAIGLVKLVSDGTSEQKYKIELTALLKNVKPKIDPKTAIMPARKK